MAAATDPLQSEIDRLYGLPLDDFTGARDELAKRLRGAGDRAAAEIVKRLRKPNLPAWALNRVCRRQRKRVDALLAAGQRLRQAQERLVSEGQRGLLRQAAAEERELVEELVGLAERELAEAGHPVNATLESKLWGTARAAASDPEVRKLLEAGRLLRDHQVSDLGLVEAGPIMPRRDTGRRKAEAAAARKAQAPASRKAEAAAARKAQAAAARKAEAVRRQLERAGARVNSLEEQLRAAKDHVAELEQTLAEAEETAENPQA